MPRRNPTLTTRSISARFGWVGVGIDDNLQVYSSARCVVFNRWVRITCRGRFGAKFFLFSDFLCYVIGNAGDWNLFGIS